MGVAALGLTMLAACSKPPAAAGEATIPPEVRLQQIPPADPHKYAGMRDMKGWRNPYLILRPDGVGLLDPANNEQRLLKTDELVETLAALPIDAWPYGRVVVVAESSPIDAEDQKVAVRRVKGIVAGTLESLHIQINWVPSA